MSERDQLVEDLDQAIRAGLRASGVKGVLAHHVGAVLDEVLPVLASHEPTIDEVVQSIQEHNGFMRRGDGMSMPDGRQAGSRVLTEALLRLWRESALLKVPE